MNGLWKILLIFGMTLFFSGESIFAVAPVPQRTPGFIPYIPVSPSITPTAPVKKVLEKKLLLVPEPTYSLIRDGKAIDIYHDPENKVYVQKISLGSGATITSVFDFHTYDEQSGEPLYVKFSPQVKIRDLGRPPTTFINGQFFDPARKYTPFSFGFKMRNTILTAGSDNRGEKKNIFSYSREKGARIIPYTWEAFEKEQAEFAQVNLSIEEKDEHDFFIGRTYLCIFSPDKDGYSDTVLSFSFIAATEGFALETLRSWGCYEKYTSRLDSSGSSVFGLGDRIEYGYTKKGAPDYRKIPQIIAFYEE